MTEGTAQVGVVLGLQSSDERRTFVVNSMPIVGSDGKRRGALATFDDVTSIEQKNEQLEETLSALKASRDDIRRQNRELALLATLDPLTGCLNRRALFAEFDDYWNSSVIAGGSIGCIMVDIDHFKSINDEQGHSAGDEVLKQVALALRSNVRQGDFVGRYGGEEFCVLLPSATLEKTGEVAEALRAKSPKSAVARV